MSQPPRSALLHARCARSRAAAAILGAALVSMVTPQLAVAHAPVARRASTLSIDDVSKNEGDSGTKTFTFTVTLTGAADPFYVDANTVDGTAASGFDYASDGGTATFNGLDGETLTFSVEVFGDTTAESDETFFVDLSNIFIAGTSGSIGLPTLAKGRGVGTIRNDDEGGGGGGGGGGSDLTVIPDQRNFAVSGGAGTIEVGGGDIAWTARSDASWLQITGGASGTGPGAVAYTVDYSTDIDGPDGFGFRVGTITINEEEFEAVQQVEKLQPAYDPPTETTYTFYGRYSGGVGSAGRDPLTTTWVTRYFRPNGVGIPTAAEGIPVTRLPSVGGRVAAQATVRGVRDFDGDGLEEVPVLGPERSGAARGAWLQLFNSKGDRLVNTFPGQEFPSLQFMAIDTDGDGKAEPVFLGIEASGAAELQLRSSKGSSLDRRTVAEADALDARLMLFEFDGSAGSEIGIAYQGADGSGNFAVWDRPDGANKLEPVADELVIPSKSSLHQWLALDVNGDGLDEVVASYADAKGKGSTLRIVDPRTGGAIADRRVLRPKFDHATWAFGDFRPDNDGFELLVGGRRTKKGTASFQVLGGDGKLLAKANLKGKNEIRTWGAIQASPGPRGTQSSLVFVGYTTPAGEGAFEVWDPEKKKAKRVGEGTVADKNFEVLEWKLDDFDGDADNGAEIVAVTRDLRDGSIGFQLFGRDGEALADRVVGFEGEYVSPRAGTLVFERKNRTDLMIMARTIGGKPVVRIWNVNSGALLFELDVLSADVE